ncbi:MAG: ester cyclase [Candidatus Thorarchaeota archaeon]|jgi:predicted ester cyclase
MSIQENKDIVRRINDEVWGKGNLVIVDDLYTTNYVDHNPMPGMTPDREGLKQSVNIMRAAFPDLQTRTEDLVAEGDKVASRWTAIGTHKGEFMGIAPSSKQVTVTGMQISRIVDGKVVEDWTEFDMMGMMQQVGAVPSP